MQVDFSVKGGRGDTLWYVQYLWSNILSGKEPIEIVVHKYYTRVCPPAQLPFTLKFPCTLCCIDV